MQNNKFFIFLLLLFVGCTNLSTRKPVFTPLEKTTLSNDIKKISKSLKSNNTSEIIGFFEDTYSNRKALAVLKTIDFSSISIFSSPIDFTTEKPHNILGFSYFGETFYYLITYSYQNNKWQISTFTDHSIS